ncbi:DUF6053 domain-containing protein [Lysobacter enzymogenes]|uniref:DUF6053 domain-containing protein n=1 Tax=Lysobacter enzymogenes TaxID=69 RepID=UPI00374A890C
MGGPSGPTLFCPIAATGNKSVGPEGPPTGAGAASSAQPLSRAARARRSARRCRG